MRIISPTTHLDDYVVERATDIIGFLTYVPLSSPAPKLSHGRQVGHFRTADPPTVIAMTPAPFHSRELLPPTGVFKFQHR